MDKKRRALLKIGGNLAAGLAIAPFACKLMPKDPSLANLKQKKMMAGL